MYELRKPITDTQRADFIVEYNHNQGLRIDEGSDTYTENDLTFKGEFIFALEANEIMDTVEAEIDVPDFETVEKEIVNPETGKIEIIEVQEPVMVDKEIEVPEYDEEGNIIGYHTEIIQVQSYHKETVEVYKPVVDPEWEEKEAQRREAEFNEQFFQTSLGYIRRTVTMANGSHKDFLSDLLPAISASVSMGQAVNLIAYDKPPFDKDIEDWTEYQHIVQATAQFIQECFLTLSNDFLPINEEE